MTDKDSGLGSKLLGLFVTQEGEQEATTDVDVDSSLEANELTPERKPITARPAKGMPPTTASHAGRQANNENELLSADFDQVYLSLCSGTDPNAEAILTAYGEMSGSLQGNMLQTAMASMIKGIRADVGAVSRTFKERADQLAAVAKRRLELAEQSRRVRAGELAEQRRRAQEETLALQARIASLAAAVAQDEQATATADADEKGAVQAFSHRAEQERIRLESLRTFLDQLARARPNG